MFGLCWGGFGSIDFSDVWSASEVGVERSFLEENKRNERKVENIALYIHLHIASPLCVHFTSCMCTLNAVCIQSVFSYFTFPPKVRSTLCTYVSINRYGEKLLLFMHSIT